MADRPPGPTFGLQPADALKHLLVVGPTGVGKSTFLFWLALSAIRQGHGVLLLDPKGDLARALLAAIPAERERDVLDLDFADTAWPVALNPLDVRDAAEGDRVAMAVYSMVRELVRGEDFLWGTSMSQAFAFGFRTLRRQSAGPAHHARPGAAVHRPRLARGPGGQRPPTPSCARIGATRWTGSPCASSS